MVQENPVSEGVPKEPMRRAWNMGFSAFLNKDSEDPIPNPYPIEHPQRKAFFDGWFDAKYAEKVANLKEFETNYEIKTQSYWKCSSKKNSN